MGIGMLAAMLIVLLLSSAVPASAETKEVPWNVGPSGRGRLPEWKGVEGRSSAKDRGSLTLEPEAGRAAVACEISRDWSGYRALELDASCEKAAVVVTLTDPKGVRWTAEGVLSEKPLVLAFDRFRAESGAGKLDLALLKSARIEFRATAPVALRSIALSGSKGLYGPGVNMDVAFQHYHSKPWPEIVQEAKDKGFTCIHVVDVDLRPEGFAELARKVTAIREAGLVAVLTNYPTTDHIAHDEHPEWRQKALNGSSRFDWRTYLCPNNEEFSRFQEQKVAKAVATAAFDVIELAEPWFEVWGGPEVPEVGGQYSCLCDHCRAKFKAISGVDPRELFDKAGERYFRRNPEVYEQWVRFRVDSLESFMKRLFAAAKKARPGIGTATMIVSDCRTEPGKGREYQGQDFDSQVKSVKPDALVVESAWQDWMQTTLDPVYIADYGKFYAPRRGKTRLLSQCDIGSSKDAKRGIEWLRKFSSISTQAGFEGYVAYEYSVGLDTTGP